MKRKRIDNKKQRALINALIFIFGIASFLWCVVTDGMMSLIGMISAIFAVIALVDLNTDYIENY